ncbi:PAS domain-containing sensor histidine kinase [Anaeromyxobacter oryzae]|nr:PAS domain-containing sensor histidine kinase [Anaeromyxobacter oryzae]
MAESRAPRARRLAVVSVAAFVAFWFFDAAVDAYIWHEGTLRETLVRPEPIELWFRAVVTALVVLVYRGRWASARLRLLYSALDAAPDGIQVVDLQGGIAYSNAAVETIYGFSPDEFHGRNVNDMNADPTFAARVILPAIQREGRWAGEIEVKHKDGRTFTIWLKTSVVLNRRGTPMAAIGVIRDIAERKRQEQELRNYARQLEEATRIKDLFADILRHDLLGPAAAMQMSVETLLKQGPSSPAAARLLAGAKRSCAKLTDMIEAAATYAKLSAARDIEFGTVDLGGVLNALPYEFELPLAERNARLTVDAPGAYPARANEIVSQVFSNLVSNAIKYGPPGGTIEVAVSDAGERWRVSVADSGEGIPDADKERVFTRFERAAKEGVKGTGLGLAIARRIVDLHGGRIWIEDNPRGGAVFCVALPKA